MKNMNRLIFTAMVMTLKFTGMQAFGMGADPDTYSPSQATTTFIKFMVTNPLDETIDTSALYGKYYPALNVATIKQSSDNAMLYKFTDVVAAGNAIPEGKTLIGSYGKSAPTAQPGQPRHGGVRIINLYGVEQK